MPPLHPAYVYGPYVFFALSLVLSARLAPRLVERLEAARQRRHVRREAKKASLEGAWVVPYRSSPMSYLLAVAMALSLVWAAGSVLGGAALAIAWWGRGPLDSDALPGERLDAFALAHAAPPLSKTTAELMIAQLEEGAQPHRFDPRAAVEQRIARATSLDPDSDRATERLMRLSFRTRAGLVALAQPTPKSCALGLKAFADVLSENGVAQLATACRNVPGDVAAPAFFALGDFRNANGRETEAILSRLPFAPAGEPDCQAGGDVIPPFELPLCRLVHAEVRGEARESVLTEPASQRLPLYARRWDSALRARRGGRLQDRFDLDVVAFGKRPLETLADHPLALYLELEAKPPRALGPADGIWVTAMAAAERSAFGLHQEAQLKCELCEQNQGAANLSVAEGRTLRRLCAVVAWRAGAEAEAIDALWQEPSFGSDDPLLPLFEGSGARPLDELRAAFGLAPESCGAGLANALSGEQASALIESTGLRDLGACAGDPALLGWLREAFPSCKSCDYFAHLVHLTRRRDIAEALGAEKVLEDLAMPIARFRAVFENRPLGLILRAGHTR